MKYRLAFLLALAIVCVALVACGGSSSEKTPHIDLPLSETAEPSEIETAFRQIVKEKYDKTDVDRITLNKNLGTEDNDQDYVALVYLTWNVKNGADMTKRMMAMYSEDLAARTATNIPNISELCVFWTIPYYDENDTSVKYSYERRDSGMYQTDEFISNKIR